MKPITFLGNSLECLREFPEEFALHMEGRCSVDPRPIEVPKLVEMIRQGYDVVYSRYAVKRHHPLRNLASRGDPFVPFDTPCDGDWAQSVQRVQRHSGVAGIRSVAEAAALAAAGAAARCAGGVADRLDRPDQGRGLRRSLTRIEATMYTPSTAAMTNPVVPRPRW